MSELIQEAGAPGYLLLLLGFLGLPLGVGALAMSAVSRAFRPALVLAGLVLGLGLMSLTLSVSWRSSSRSSSMRAIAHAAPEDRSVIMAVAFAESNSVTTLGALVGLPMLLLAGGAFGAAFARTGSRA